MRGAGHRTTGSLCAASLHDALAGDAEDRNGHPGVRHFAGSGDGDAS